MAEESMHQDTGWVNTFVFIAGFLLGAGTAIMLTPESGTQLRSRLSRGAKTAQDEFADMAAQTKEAVNAWSQEAKDTMRHAAARVHTAVDATKQSVTMPTQEILED